MGLLHVTVEPLVEFRNLPPNTPLDSIEIPERPENRKITNIKHLIFFIAVVVLLFPFLIYCMVVGDLSRLNGYDQCGNVCGRKNVKYDGWPCTGQDFTDLPYLQVDATSKISGSDFLLSPRRCVARCGPDYIRISSTCYKLSNESQSSFEDEQSLINDGFLDFRAKRDSDNSKGQSKNVQQGPLEYLNENTWRIVLACLVSIPVSIVMLVLFKIATAIVVWGFIAGFFVIGAVCIGLISFSYELFNLPEEAEMLRDILPVIAAIIFVVIWLVLLGIVIFMYRKIQLVIQLLKEAAKATYAMPMVFLFPVYFFLFNLIVVILHIYTSGYIISSGLLTEIEPGYYYYENNKLIRATFAFNLFVTLWSLEFLLGIKYMVIAGAVAKWYWAKDKNNLGRPISTSARVAIKFHLGSIAFGSLVIIMFFVLRQLVNSCCKSRRMKCFKNCLEWLEAFLKFLMKNSYILTAMHGQPFFKSGKRAARIIFQNVVNIISINCLGDFVLVMAQLLIVLISMLITIGIMQGAESKWAWIIYLIVFFVSLFIADIFFGTFETTIDTIFLCFCEDSLLNNGVSRPYAMSRDLMEFVDKSKKLYKKKEAAE